MELKSIFKMVKANRYTQDGRDEIAKLQAEEVEDVRYKTGDISQKTGLQKQPDGSWAPPKGGKPAAKKEAGSINRTPERIAKETAIMEALNLSTGEDNNLHKMSDETIERLYAKTQEAESKPAAKPTTEELNTLKDIMREYRKNPNKQTEQIMNEAKSHLMKNRGMTPEQLGKLGREVMAETNKPTDKYKDLPGAQKKDALYAATFEGSSIGMTQTSMERNGWDLIQADDDVNVYAKPDGSKVTMKHDGKTITSSEYEAPTEIKRAQDYIKKYAEKYVNGKQIQDINIKDDGAQSGFFVFEFDADGEKYQMAYDFGYGGKQDKPSIKRIASDAAPKIRELTGDCKIRIRPETQDKVYQIGEISQKTGLQKTANGWRPPQETKFGKVKQNKEGQWGVQVKQGKGSDFLKHKSEAEAKRALSNYTAGYNTTERSKEDPHSDKARQAKQWRKEDEKAAKARRAEGRAAHAAQFQKEEIPQVKGMDAEQYDKKLRQEGWKQTGEYAQNKAGYNVGYFEKNGKRIQVVENSEGRIAGVDEVKPKTEAKPGSKPGNYPGWEETRMASGKIYDLKSQGKRIIEQYDPETETKTFKLRDLNNSRSPDKEFKSLEEAKSAATDSAPRILTGDTKIRVKK